MMNEIKRRPLFYFFLLLCATIIIEQSLATHFFSIRQNDITKFTLKQASDAQKIFIGGTIVSEVDTRNSFYNETLSTFVLKVKKCWDSRNIPSPLSGKVKVYARNPAENFFYGDEIVLEGTLKEPSGRRNPGGFDQKAYLKRDDISAVFYTAKDFKYKILGRGKGFFLKQKAIQCKQFLSKQLSSHFDAQTAAFLKAFFLGERSDISGPFMDLFMNTGTVHILSVSGFHTGFVLLIVFSVLKLFRLSRDYRYLASIAFIWLYSFVIGWQAPMVRACIMATLFMTGRVLGRKSDALNLIGCAGIIILIFKPLSVFDAGFQLSFLTVTGLVIFMPIFVEREKLLPNEKWTLKEKAYFYFRDIFWGSFICMAVSLPVTIQNFYIVTPSSLAANLVVIPVTFLLFVMGFIYFVTFWWVPSFLSFIPSLITLLMKGLTASLFIIEQIPGAFIIVGRLNEVLCIILAAGILYFMGPAKLKGPWARLLAVVLFASAVLVCQEAIRRLDHRLKMTVLDVGQGDAIFFKLPDGKTLLMDAGKGGHEGPGDRGRSVVAPFLKSQGIRAIDLLVFSHPQEDHIGGMAAVFKDFKVKNVLESGFFYESKLYQHVKDLMKAEKCRVLTARSHMNIGEAGSGIKLTILNPQEKNSPSKNINNESVVLKLQYKNTNFMLTGDIQEEAMRNILSVGDNLKSDVLKVPHHGARLTEIGKQFVREVQPKYSLISVGEHNSYHHPSFETLKTLQSIPQNTVLRTDQNCAIQVVSDGQTLQVNPYCN